MKIMTKTLVAVAKATMASMGKNDVRYYLNGVHLTYKDNKVFVETTDGHRLSQVKIDVDDGYKFDVIIDRDTWVQISKIKTNKKDNSIVELDIDGERLLCFNGAVIPLEYIDGKFPDIERVIPDWRTTHNNGGVGVSAVYMSEAFKSASILANPKHKGVTLTTFGASDALLIRVPTDHYEFVDLTEPATFAVMPMRM